MGMTFRDARAAFSKAIQSGRLSASTAAVNYAGNYMYMGTSNGIDQFKHVVTREYRGMGRMIVDAPVPMGKLTVKPGTVISGYVTRNDGRVWEVSEVAKWDEELQDMVFGIIHFDRRVDSEGVLVRRRFETCDGYKLWLHADGSLTDTEESEGWFMRFSDLDELLNWGIDVDEI
jgi:hypothetical protein